MYIPTMRMLKKLKHDDFYIQKVEGITRVIGMKGTGVVLYMYTNFHDDIYEITYPVATYHKPTTTYRYQYEEEFKFTENVRDNWKWRKLKKNEFTVVADVAAF